MSASRPRAQQPDRLMRYRFDSAAQARQHVHVLDRRQLLFFPDPFLDVRDGQPVLLELCFLHSEQTLVARGAVHSIETGALRGAWLELYGTRLFEGMQTPAALPAVRGKVLRAREGDLSVQFQRDDATTRRGAIKLVELAVRRWADAREARHPGACACMRGGALYEPLLPRAAYRRLEGLG